MLRRLRRQLPAWSPVAPVTIARTALGFGISDARARLSELLCREYSASASVLTDSGTQALQLALELAWCARGRKGAVALPAFACFDLATAAVGAGVPVSFFDVEPTTLAPDLDSVEMALRHGASVVVVAPLYGMPPPWDELEELAERFGAILIEDAAQGHGGRWRGRPLGSLGSLSVLSFGRGKGWTGGGGGALLLRGELPQAMPTLQPAVVGQDVKSIVSLLAQWLCGRPEIYGLPASLPFLRLGETVYRDPVAPRSIGRAAANLALEHHALAAASASRRKVTATKWRSLLDASSVLQPIDCTPAGEAGYLRFPALDRWGLFVDCAHCKSAGIMPSYQQVLPDLPVFDGLHPVGPRNWPGARLLTRSLVTLPTHERITATDEAEIAFLLTSRSTGNQCKP